MVLLLLSRPVASAAVRSKVLIPLLVIQCLLLLPLSSDFCVLGSCFVVLFFVSF